MMAGFDPDAYLASKAQSGDFDPDAYLKAKDPNAYDTDKDYEPNNRIDRLKAKAKAAYRELSTPDNKFTSAQPVEKIAKGIGETTLQSATGLAGTVAGGLAGIGSTVGNTAMGVAQGTPLKEAFQGGLKAGSDAVQGVSSAMTYQPKTATGILISELSATPMDLAKEISGAVGGSITSGMAGQTLPAQPVAGPNAVPLDKQREAQRQFQLANGGGGEALGRTIGELVPAVAATLAGRKPVEAARVAADAAKAPVMAGGGAAAVEAETLRRQKANALPVPMGDILTPGMAERDAAKLKEERELTKNPKYGGPLRDRVDDLNEKLLLNFGALKDMTGAETAGLRASGQVVDKALVMKSRKAKQDIRDAYAKAEKAGAMNDKTGVSPLESYLSSKWSERDTAPILKTIYRELNTRAGKPKKDIFGQPVEREISVHDAEEIRKVANKFFNDPGVNSTHVKPLTNIIDKMTEDKGGPEYRSARRLNENYSNEFKNVGVIAKLLRTKPGTNDRAVGYEDVFNHTIMSGTLDDVRHVRRTLQTAGPEGEQAWKELQGQTIEHIKNAATQSATTNERGHIIVSADKLNKTVKGLDEDGKLDFIFGKKGAQTVRDLNDVASDILTVPPNAGINWSNSGITLINAAMDHIAKLPYVGVPVRIMTKLHSMAKEAKGEMETKKKVSAILEKPKPADDDPLGLMKEESSETK